jgi:2-keto-4-pentenoate hydratase/2-oxohepta-3-ene-1,7-dioic acid hydratase in catechol pathway
MEESADEIIEEQHRPAAEAVDEEAARCVADEGRDSLHEQKDEDLAQLESALHQNLRQHEDYAVRLQNWDEMKDLVFELGNLCATGKFPEDHAIASEAIELCPPVIYPNKLICAGANFYAHVREMGTKEIEKDKLNPFFFLKPPSTTMIGSGAMVPMPVGDPDLDWELELAVIIGRRCRRVRVH